ncbi:VTT domain-containing protein [Haloechinothrix sp. LS1_15]|uniref:DedA family protein n=1 Tax=Haloechinothrix sp. LS1_15 TaxID=2652248 RepID=UPI0029451049|nr:VTT domain-containing protein [Haloechinothrix sp. LS1_15]MDV6011112.1 DedA family protein [Haloechinothrix sp. LS1_15]
MIADFLAWLASLPPKLLILVAALLVGAETTVGLGMIAPGESALLLVGTTATSPERFIATWMVTSIFAVAGYCIGYALGYFLGPRIRQSTLIRRYGAGSWDSATAFLRRRGPLAVMIAIYLPVMRSLVPAAAGAAGLPLRRFLPAATLAGVSWCALHIALGALAGAAARRIEEALEYGSLVVLGLIVIAVAVLVVRKRRKRPVTPAPEPQHVP